MYMLPEKAFELFLMMAGYCFKFDAAAFLYHGAL
jgi:hypothetical protein